MQLQSGNGAGLVRMIQEILVPQVLVAAAMPAEPFPFKVQLGQLGLHMQQLPWSQLSHPLVRFFHDSSQVTAMLPPEPLPGPHRNRR